VWAGPFAVLSAALCLAVAANKINEADFYRKPLAKGWLKRLHSVGKKEVAMLPYIGQGLLAIVVSVVLLNLWYWQLSERRRGAGLCTMCGEPASREMCDECEMDLMTP
jgi:hypothetical protein